MRNSMSWMAFISLMLLFQLISCEEIEGDEIDLDGPHAVLDDPGEPGDPPTNIYPKTTVVKETLKAYSGTWNTQDSFDDYIATTSIETEDYYLGLSIKPFSKIKGIGENYDARTEFKIDTLYSWKGERSGESDTSNVGCASLIEIQVDKYSQNSTYITDSQQQLKWPEDELLHSTYPPSFSHYSNGIIADAIIGSTLDLILAYSGTIIYTLADLTDNSSHGQSSEGGGYTAFNSRYSDNGTIARLGWENVDTYKRHTYPTASSGSYEQYAYDVTTHNTLLQYINKSVSGSNRYSAIKIRAKAEIEMDSHDVLEVYTPWTIFYNYIDVL